MFGRRPLLLLLLFSPLFLALAGTGAGLPGAGLAVSAPQRPTRAVAVQSPFPGGPQPSAGPRDGSGVPSTSEESPSDPPERRSPESASEAPMVDGGQTRPQTRTEDQMGARTSERPYTASPPFTPTMATMMPSWWTFRPTWTPLANLPARTPRPASPGAPAVGTEGGGSEVQETSTPSLLALGSRGPLVRQASWTGTEPSWSPQPGQEAAKGPTGAVGQTASSVSAEKSESPITEPAWPPGATGPTVQEAEAPSEETLGMPPVSVWQLLLSPSKPGPSRLPMLPGASGPDRDMAANATAWGQPLPRTGNGVLLLTEGRMPQELPGAAFLPVPCELVLAMAFSRSFRDPGSPEYRHLVGTINETVTPRLASLPGFQRLEVKALRPGSVVVEFDALFLPQAPGLWAALSRSSLSERLPPGLLVGNASVLRSVTQERRLDLCALLFSCHAGYECLAQENGSALCVSLCHRDYCKNQGICLHVANHTPVCQCPVGHDFWFLGLHCDYKVTQQGLLGAACGLLLSLVVLGVVVAGLVTRRVRLLLLEAKADQTKSSYRRFCRLDDVSAHYWSEPWLASTTSLDNPAFSNSEELLHLQRLEGPACFGCPEEDGRGPGAPCRQTPDTPRGLGAVGQRPSCRYNWAESVSSLNDPMVDSGKASEVSVSSWPMEPLQWSPLPALHKLPRDQGEARAPRPNSCCEGMELVNLERSWTA
ncbi:hypothetical protein JRQ81_010253 [Phrynocephalus forsythii]|uniref:Interphotoreceptor matrix proteoglycan 1 n=1 Tax=Phrynocephalus forsythii TaxID=171643 RepID=A0A9Q0XA76_9SAUR|nr:hypothetical protein JRQ81_010253 [Phrynocephalus forsythii]